MGLDSGSSSHVFHNRDMFVEYGEYKKDMSQLETGRTIQTEGRGTIQINGTLLYNVLYLPTSEYHLLSVLKLIREGYKVKFDHEGAIYGYLEF